MIDSLENYHGKFFIEGIKEKYILNEKEGNYMENSSSKFIFRII